ncbi:hypothetical protein [Streptomyces sp. NPDC048248]|uniref:hypothetical protein n=1 Tax=Streptomyces sp. NPDC048248 TaxID=3365523 RepID=UPI00371AF706
MELLVLAVIIVFVMLAVAGAGDSGGGGTESGWNDRPPGIDKKSWKKMRQESERIKREIRKNPPSDGGAGGDFGRGGHGCGGGCGDGG